MKKLVCIIAVFGLLLKAAFAQGVVAAWSQCTPPASGYNKDVVARGSVGWSALVGTSSGYKSDNVTMKIRIRGTGTVTITNGDLKLVGSGLLVVDGPKLIVNNGNFILEKTTRAIISNGALRTFGNIQQAPTSYLCISDSEVECGDELAGGLFSASSSSANFQNDGGKRYLKNVCMNVTHDFQLQSTTGGEDRLVSVWAEIGDKGSRHQRAGKLDGDDSGNFQNSGIMNISNSQFIIAENVQNQSSGKMSVAGISFRTMNGNFENSGLLSGGLSGIWVDDKHSIKNSGNAKTLIVGKRRGLVSGSFYGMPANSTAQLISASFTAECSARCPLVISFSSMPSCAQSCNGQASVTVSGGIAPYSFSWSNNRATATIGNVCAGTYSVTVTDANSCSASGSTAVAALNNLQLSASGVNVFMCGNNNTICSDFDISVLPHGTNVKTYFWYTGVTVSVVPGGPQSKDPVIYNTNGNWTEDSDLNLDLGNVIIINENPNNNDGDGTGPDDSQKGGCLVFSFARPVTVVSFLFLDSEDDGGVATAYDANNVVIASAPILNFGDASIQTVMMNAVGATKLEICYPASGAVRLNLDCPKEVVCNGSAMASATGGVAPYSYSWSNGVNSASIADLCAGIYDVTVTDSKGCNSIARVNIGETPMQLSLSSISETCAGSCNGSATALAIGGTAPYEYMWGIEGGEGATISGYCAGNFTVTATDAAGCTVAGAVDISSGACKMSGDETATSLSEQSASIKAYPNPFSESATLEFSVNTIQNVKAEVVTVDGRKVMTLFEGIANSIKKYSFKISGDDFATGMHFFIMTSEDGTKHVSKLFITK